MNPDEWLKHEDSTNREILTSIMQSYESGMPFRDISDSSPYPLRVALKRPFSLSSIPRHMDRVLTWQRQIEAFAQRNGLEIEYRDHSSRAFGRQRIPEALIIPDGPTHAEVLRVGKQYRKIRESLTLIHEQAHELFSWSAANQGTIAEAESSIPALLRVYIWRKTHPELTPFIRELNLEGVHTKLVERHQKLLAAWFKAGLDEHWLQERRHFKDFSRRYGFARERRRIRFRFLSYSDSPLAGISDFELYQHEVEPSFMQNIHSVIIVENHLSFLSLQARKGVAAIDGSGYGAATLVSLSWLREKRILYFGDCDAHGLDILSRLRSSLPKITSICMNLRTFETFAAYSTHDSSAPISTPHNLDERELKLFNQLHDRSLKGQTNRLEQERIPLNFVMAELDTCLY